MAATTAGATRPSLWHGAVRRGPATGRPAPALHMALQPRRHHRHTLQSGGAATAAAGAQAAVRPEAEVPNMTAFLDSLKWDKNGLVVAIAQHVDTGEVLMQAFADRAAVSETLQTGCACWLAPAAAPLPPRPPPSAGRPSCTLTSVCAGVCRAG